MLCCYQPQEHAVPKAMPRSYVLGLHSVEQQAASHGYYPAWLPVLIEITNCPCLLWAHLLQVPLMQNIRMQAKGLCVHEKYALKPIPQLLRVNDTVPYAQPDVQ